MRYAPAVRLLAVLLMAATLIASGVVLRAYLSEKSALCPARRAVPLPRAAELAALEAVELPTDDGGVRAWYQRSSNGALVLLVHGLGGDREELVPHARALARHGYGVLFFDLPGHGESPGSVTAPRSQVGALQAAVTLAANRSPADRLGVYGFSFGGCVALEVAAREPRLAAVVLEETPSDLERQLAYEHRRWGRLALWGARLALRQGGFDMGAYDPLAAIARVSPRAVLLIAGSEDRTVATEMARELYAATAGPRELWLVAGAGHGEVAEREPAELERRLAAFFDRHLLGGR